MIPFEKALEIALAGARELGAERVNLADSLGRVLAQDVDSDVDMPPFDKAAMDGYACRREDLGGALRVVEEIPAGRSPTKRVGPRECSKIMTGAMAPEGADCVVMVEYTEQLDARTVQFTGKNTRNNICPQGEDVRVGDRVLEKGARLTPQHIAVLASVGCAEPLVARRPRVAVLATGDELVEPHETPGPSQIRTSNSYQLCAQITAVGAIPDYHGIVADTEDATHQALKRALASSDVVLVSGGVSMGDYDFVPDVMRRNGLDILFDSVAVKPGKPTTFGLGDGVSCIGLPGNPVSTFIQFEILVKPLLWKLMGCNYRAPSISLPLERPFARKKTDREAWIPVTITTEGTIRLREYHGSAHVNALCGADGLIVIPLGTACLEEGATVDVRLI